MISIERAERHLPVGTRVQHRSRGWVGTVAVHTQEDPKYGPRGIRGRSHLANERSICFAINVDWDDGRAEWMGTPDLLKLPDSSPSDVIEALNAEMANVGVELTQEQQDDHDATTALRVAHLGKADKLDALLARCSPEVLEGLAAAARLLASATERRGAAPG